MWWSERATTRTDPERPARRHVLLGMMASLPLVSACGFAPVYGDGSAARALTGTIAVEEIAGAMGFAARQRLTERLGPATAATHRLDVTIALDSDGLAISQTNQITRYNLTGTASYDLVDMATGVKVEAGTARAFAAYSATASPFATRVAERDARSRLAVSLADQIVIRIAASATRWSR